MHGNTTTNKTFNNILTINI